MYSGHIKLSSMPWNIVCMQESFERETFGGCEQFHKLMKNFYVTGHKFYSIYTIIIIRLLLACDEREEFSTDNDDLKSLYTYTKLYGCY